MPPVTLRATMRRFREEHVVVDGVDTAVLTAGAGESLVFLHGGGTVAGFDMLLPLADRFKLLVPHHPGFGASADDPTITSGRDYVRHYAAFLTRLELEATALAGTSLGGYLAALFAAEHPERVKSLVLVCPFGLEVPEYPTTDTRGIPPEELLSWLTSDPAVVAALPEPDEASLARRARERDTARRLSLGPHDPSLPQLLAQIAAPTLLLWGDADRMIPAGQAATWAELIPDALIRIFPGRGHLLLAEDPEAVLALGEFAHASSFNRPIA
jgi:pimeloyl-ACP methyl ester carboxylesterase